MSDEQPSIRQIVISCILSDETPYQGLDINQAPYCNISFDNKNYMCKHKGVEERTFELFYGGIPTERLGYSCLKKNK